MIFGWLLSAALAVAVLALVGAAWWAYVIGLLVVVALLLLLAILTVDLWPR